MFNTSWLRYIPYLQTEHYWALLWHIYTGSVPHSSWWTPVYVTHLGPIQSEACKTKAFPSTNCGGTVGVVTSWAVRSEWSLQGWCCRSCQGSILGHTLCGSWGGSPGNEAAERADVCYTWCRQTREESYTHLWSAQLKQHSVRWHSKIGCVQP